MCSLRILGLAKHGRQFVYCSPLSLVCESFELKEFWKFSLDAEAVVVSFPSRRGFCNCVRDLKEVAELQVRSSEVEQKEAICCQP